MRLLPFLLLVLFSSSVWAKQLVLVQGYLGTSKSWKESGVIHQLEKNGWNYAGEWFYGSHGATIYQPAPIVNRQGHKDDYYRVSLPTEASIEQQAYYLKAYLKRIKEQYPQQDLILVGHSAGGVVSRYTMVRNPGLDIKMLITIASPHLGTDSAELGKQVADSPFSLLAPIIGAGTITRSKGLYKDLLPERPNRFLFWLNRQPHPEAEYISIVRDNDSPNGGDFIVPSRSQYLEHVYSLRYRALSYVVRGSHGLNAADGSLLVDLLNERVIQPI